MQLTYRGVTYQPSPATLPTTVGPEIGQYRGATLHRRSLSVPLSCTPKAALVYRGVPYGQVACTSTVLLTPAYPF